MFKFIYAPYDYLLFVAICVSVLAAITFWLWRSECFGRTIIVAWVGLPTLLVPGWFLVDIAGQSERNRMKEQIKGLAPTYAYELASMGHAKIDLDTAEDDPLYRKMIQKQIRWLRINSAIADVYTFRRYDGVNRIMVDSETDYDGDGLYMQPREKRTQIGETWDENNHFVRSALQGNEAFDDTIYTDFWGTWVSAYVPMLDEEGEFDAVLGVDFPAKGWIEAISRARLLAIGFLSVIVTAGFASASIISVLRANLRERERAARDLLLAKNVAEAATKSKSEFLANMSHEIRTPMNGIVGMTDLLAGTPLNDQQGEFLRIVKQSADSLLGLLNDILDFSKIEAGKLELESIQFRLRDTVERTLQTLAFRAGEKGLEICCRIDPDVPDRLIGDPGRLSQVLVNLAGNAIKFTDEGEVVINLDMEPTAENRVSLRCAVRDTGIGIAAEKIDSIFSAFSQEDSSTTRRFGGTGLGLAISTQLVKMMGGRIWAESEQGKGATFFFTSSFGVASETLPSWPPLEKLADMPVLVVDDNSTNRIIMDEILRGWHLKPVLADGGPAALGELKLAVSHGHPFQLALIDCMMPDMDGFEFARVVRSDPQLSDCKIVMISSAASGDDIKTCRDLGIARYMTKPVIQSELLAAILEITSESLADAGDVASKVVSTGHAADSDSDVRPLRILLAEDGEVNKIVAKAMLKKHHHEVIVANDGRAALEAIKSDKFDLVLMDVHMPEMDGLEATVAIRRYEEAMDRYTPIIAMTASAMKGDREMCLDAGMDGYLSKPMESQELHDVIAQIVDEPPHAKKKTDPRLEP